MMFDGYLFVVWFPKLLAADGDPVCLFVADKCCVEAGFPLNDGLGSLELVFDHAPLYSAGRGVHP